MHARSLTKGGHALVRQVILVGTLLTALLPVGAAHGEIGACRSDPVVVLSNGATLDLSATITDVASDVQLVTYTLSGPPGTKVVSVIKTSGILGPKESFAFTASNLANTYTVDTIVSTLAPTVVVTATTLVIRLLQTRRASVSGLSQQHLPVTIAL